MNFWKTLFGSASNSTAAPRKTKNTSLDDIIRKIEGCLSSESRNFQKVTFTNESELEALVKSLDTSQNRQDGAIPILIKVLQGCANLRSLKGRYAVSGLVRAVSTALINIGSTEVSRQLEECLRMGEAETMAGRDFVEQKGLGVGGSVYPYFREMASSIISHVSQKGGR